ncbi:MAG: N-acetyl-alpha-D-glucosaminyl L-malate synthase BshA [Chlorobi bacterium]|nr:N-acetyl-alpha-D-glucosaminyl L-malate synthase BshA [Chlorobiota bacterium]MCI0715610.1 N-acetyl-alpha-D-glucosaminyl L-malate synthase BshA [Chlorobiota bacterium]
MKIGILCYPTYGGSGVVATELGLELANRGHVVHFISYSKPMRLNVGFSDNLFFHKVEMASYPLFDFPLYSIALASRIVEVAKFNGLDLVHAHYAIPHATSAYLAREIINDEVLKKKKNGNNIKIITTLHGTDITLTGLEISFLPTLKFSIQKSDGVTAVSEFLKIKTQSQFEIQKDIRVIPNFINLNIYKKLDNKETQCFKDRICRKNEKIIVHTSNFRPLKRVEDVIRVFKLVRDKVPSKLLLIGDGPDRSNCEYLAKDLGVDSDVIFYGEQESFIELLSIADLFILPSQSESFGLSALEAMACGVPVISSNAGGLPELNLHGETGYIAEIGDVNKMADYAVKLLTDPNIYRIFSENALERATNLFSSEKIIPQYEKYYEEVLSK